MPFVNAERTGNADAVANATQMLGGPDLISTRLWWESREDSPNFLKQYFINIIIAALVNFRAAVITF